MANVRNLKKDINYVLDKLTKQIIQKSILEEDRRREPNEIVEPGHHTARIRHHHLLLADDVLVNPLLPLSRWHLVGVEEGGLFADGVLDETAKPGGEVFVPQEQQHATPFGDLGT